MWHRHVLPHGMRYKCRHGITAGEQGSSAPGPSASSAGRAASEIQARSADPQRNIKGLVCPQPHAAAAWLRPQLLHVQQTHVQCFLAIAGGFLVACVVLVLILSSMHCLLVQNAILAGARIVSAMQERVLAGEGSPFDVANNDMLVDVLVMAQAAAPDMAADTLSQAQTAHSAAACSSGVLWNLASLIIHGPQSVCTCHL